MSSTFDKNTVGTDAALALSSQIKGKNIFITGSTVGSLGGDFVKAVAPYADTIWIAGRSQERLQAAADYAVEGLTGSKASIEIVILDLNSLDSVREAAAKVNATGKPIHVLVNNVATVPSATLGRTAEGLEAQFGIDHLAHFLLASLLYPRLKQAAATGSKARVVAVSSAVQAMSPGIRWDDANYELRPEEYERYSAYAQAKLANIIFAQELTRRSAKDGVIAYSLHPSASDTNGGKELPRSDLIAFGMLKEDGSKVEGMWSTIAQGVSNYVVAAFDPSIESQAGGYVDECILNNAKVNPFATEENGAKLWALSEELLKVKFL